MKLSDAIYKLQKLQDKYGDLDIVESLVGFKKCRYLGEDTNGKWLDKVNLVFKEYLE